MDLRNWKEKVNALGYWLREIANDLQLGEIANDLQLGKNETIT